MRPTRWTVLLAVGTVSAAAIWAVVRIIDARGGIAPVLPWTVPVALGFLAITVTMLAWSLRKRLAGGPGVRPVDPIGAARLVAVAKAASHAGALLAGGYAGLTLFGLRDAVTMWGRWVVPAASTAAAIAVVTAGMFLERVCRVKPPEDEQPLSPTP